LAVQRLQRCGGTVVVAAVELQHGGGVVVATAARQTGIAVVVLATQLRGRNGGGSAAAQRLGSGVVMAA
jgi:hypothetical protein